MTRMSLLRSAALATVCVCAFGVAQAQESPQEFMRHEWQRQHGYNPWDGQRAAPAPTPWFAPQRQQPAPGWSSYAEYTPPEEAAPQQPGSYREQSREMPQVHVDNPDFLDYTPDKLATASLATACDFQIDADGNGKPSFAFLDACMATPAVSVHALPQVAAALTAYYSAHPDFLWVRDGTISRRAYAAIAALAAADKVGLDPADYRVDIPPRPADETAQKQALLRFEFALSAKALTYVLDAQRGRINPDGLSGYHDLDRKKVDLAAALQALASSDDVAATLAAQNPDNAQFRALVGELARLRAKTPDAAAPIAPHTFISPGDDNAQLPNVIANLRRALPADLQQKYSDALAADGQHYSGDLVEAVRAFQKQKGLSPDGVIGGNTVAALTGKENGTAAKIQKVRLALERLRWLPQNFGSAYVFLNQPAFEVSYHQQGKAPLTMRAVVGRKDAQTYFFVDRIRDVQYNPYWNVPRSIVINEMLPRLYRDPSWLNQRGYEVSNARGRQVASNAVNWAAFARDKESVDVRQPPGKGNALGRVKIEFPNKHAIYMHDTNEKSLFSRDMRALSHGCVRLQHPREMAAAVLGTSVDHIDKRIASGNTESEEVKPETPVYLAYFTAWPDSNGEVHYYNDIYDRDAHLKAALDKTEAARTAD